MTVAPEQSRFELLRSITQRVAATDNLDTVLRSIVQALVSLPNMLTSRIFLYQTEEECDVCREGPVGLARMPGQRALHLGASAGSITHLDRDHHCLPAHFPVPPAQVIHSRQPMRTSDIMSDPSIRNSPELLQILQSMKAVGAAAYPLVFHGEALGSIGLVSSQAIGDEEFALQGVFADQAAIAVKNALLFRELARYRDRLEVENAYLQEQFEVERGFEGIVGQSPALSAVLRKVRQVSGVETTVLLTGETGTGKELIARALHEGSPRKERPMIKVNCGAIPQGVVESELFGHEKGAFTGALQRRIGRFELADNSTLFMDEVGELPLDTQVKLLRVLQEQEFERVGSTKPQKVDVRLVAATNRDLEREVAESRFRSDLYYRLNVFPIRIPPLRERTSDIPPLVHHFLQQFQRKLAKPLKGITPKSMARLERYRWPGNIRELQNVLERACVLSEGPVVEVTEALTSAAPGGSASSSGDNFSVDDRIVPLEENERAHIRRALAATNGKVHGEGGAAQLLGINPSTLRSRMQKLGIGRG